MLGLGVESSTIAEDKESLDRTIGSDDAPGDYEEGWDEWWWSHAVALLADSEAERRVIAADDPSPVTGPL